MPLDASIYNALRVQPKSVSDYEDEYDRRDIRKLQLAGSQQQNALAALQNQQTRQGMQRNALVQAAQRQAAETAGGDESAYAKNLRLSGFPELIDPADKVDKAFTERGKVASENAGRDVDTVNKRVTQWRDFVGMATSPDQAAILIQAMHTDPALKDTPMARVPLDQALGMLQQTPFDQWKQTFALGAQKFVEMNKPTYQQSNLGGTNRITALPGLTGAPSVVSEAPITQSADNMASNVRQAADAAASRAVQVRGQNLTNDRARDANTAAAATGKPPPGYRFTPEGNLEAIPGGPADRKNTDAGIREQRSRTAAVAQADRVISKVDEALSNVGVLTAGPGSVLAGIPGTSARNLQSTLETIKANLGFAELQAMRDASPTGGALGAIAVQELNALQSTVSSLDQGQSPTQLEKSLSNINKHYTNWKKAVSGSSDAPAAPTKTVKRTGTSNGRKVVEYTDGSVEYAD